MDKTERTIAKVTNAGRILSRIAWIFDLIACGCSAFLIVAALLWWNTRPDLFTGYASQTGALLICAGDLIGCAGSAVLAYFARQHFAHALEAQTPFKSSRRIRLSPSIYSTLIFTLPGKRCSLPPLRRA